ncbi:MAPEG family protein [Hellea sp.]|nr:MAPEG family protein [Hellea sp.]
MSISSYLILSVGLFILMVVVQALFGIKQHGLTPLVGARDNLATPSLHLDRAKRANANMIEAMVMFAPLALFAVHAGAVTAQTALAGALFFFGRLAFAPLYWLGVPWLRTIAWFVSVAGIILLFITLISFI